MQLSDRHGLIMELPFRSSKVLAGVNANCMVEYLIGR